jgi:dihydroneopterin aldolase
MSKEFDLYLGALAELGDAGVTDKIIVKNLQVPIDAGVDVWGRAKKQPALVTVTLHLARPFDSAAAADSLDNSTVHYGKLTKDLQARITQQNDDRHLTTAEAVDMISDAAATTATGAPIRAIEVDLMYPKGSMLGDGAGLLSVGIIAGSVRTCARVLYLRNVRIPCIVGVNSNERLQKQPVVVNLWVERILHHRSDSYPQLEAVLVNVFDTFGRSSNVLTWDRQFRNPLSKHWNLYRSWS